VNHSVNKLWAAGIDADVILAGGPPMRLRCLVQVGSIQTLHARAIRESRINLPDANIVIVDETHHARARTWQQLIDRYPNALILGMDATPCRGDGRGLGNIFESMVECPQVAELIEQGYLVGAKVFAPTRPDLAGFAVRHGDYVETKLEARMNTQRLVGDVLEHWHKHAESRRTVAFGVSVAHSVHMRDEFWRAGVLAEHIAVRPPLTSARRL
jgi:superfamily II DNA or RNA helicase